MIKTPILALVIVALLIAHTAADAPPKRYLFYLHGQIVEGSDGRPEHPTFGIYDYPAIIKALGLDGEAERKIAVVGVPDEKKGEAIALLSAIASDTIQQETVDLRYKLMDTGIPSLWCPREIIPVEEIPVLASGKLDIKSCQRLAAGG